MSNLGRHHSPEAKARISKGVRAAIASQDRDARGRWGSRQNVALAAEISRLKQLCLQLGEHPEGIAVRTYGPCTPGSGVLLWQDGQFALVWFNCSSAPVVWPLKLLAVIRARGEA